MTTKRIAIQNGSACTRDLASPRVNGIIELNAERAFNTLTQAAGDTTTVSGWTHPFYRYPARFSPVFAAAVISEFSRPGDVIVDPYMGGGTSVVEGLLAGRHVVGNDLNSLAAFITRVKTRPLTGDDVDSLRTWAKEVVPTLSYRQPKDLLERFIDPTRTHNMHLPRARFLKKGIAAALASIEFLPSQRGRDFARCAVLRVAQGALDGRKRHTPLDEFRARLQQTIGEMIQAISALRHRLRESGGTAKIYNMDAGILHEAVAFRCQRAKLVLTSPPYPGVHVLYHRWQVDGRRETPAPYWIAGCSDGNGAAYYNFADRRQGNSDRYFETSLKTLRAVRQILADGGYMVQLVAFNQPDDQLPKYLDNMTSAGFKEVALGDGRICRTVPNRKWHATLRGRTSSADEVVLVHQAV